MIPGNRPEDKLEEEFWDRLFDKLHKKGYKQEIIDYAMNDHAQKDSWAKLFQAAIEIARELEYTRGFNEGRAEEQMAQAMAQEEEFGKDRS